MNCSELIGLLRNILIYQFEVVEKIVKLKGAVISKSKFQGEIINMEDNDSFGKAIAALVIGISYGIAIFTSVIWIAELLTIFHGVTEPKAKIIIYGTFRLAWICSNLFALLGHVMILAFYSKARWFCIFIGIQFLLFLFVTSLISFIY